MKVLFLCLFICGQDPHTEFTIQATLLALGTVSTIPSVVVISGITNAHHKGLSAVEFVPDPIIWIKNTRALLSDGYAMI